MQISSRFLGDLEALHVLHHVPRAIIFIEGPELAIVQHLLKQVFPYLSVFVCQNHYIDNFVGIRSVCLHKFESVNVIHFYPSLYEILRGWEALETAAPGISELLYMSFATGHDKVSIGGYFEPRDNRPLLTPDNSTAEECDLQRSEIDAGHVGVQNQLRECAKCDTDFVVYYNQVKNLRSMKN